MVYLRHSYRLGAAPSEGTGSARGDTGEAEVVADHPDSRSSNGANERFEIVELRVLLRTVEQHVVPIRRVEILDRGKFQPCRLEALPQGVEVLLGPRRAIFARAPPAVQAADRLVVLLARALLGSARGIVDEVYHGVGCPALAGKVKLPLVQHVRIKAVSDLHRSPSFDAAGLLNLRPGSLGARGSY